MTNYPFEIAVGYMGPLVVNMTYLSRRAGRRKLGPVYIRWRSPFAFQLLPHITEVRPSTVFLTCDVQKFKTQPAGFFKNQTARRLSYIQNVDWFKGYLTMLFPLSTLNLKTWNAVLERTWHDQNTCFQSNPHVQYSIQNRSTLEHFLSQLSSAPTPDIFKAPFNIIFPSTPSISCDRLRFCD